MFSCKTKFLISFSMFSLLLFYLYICLFIYLFIYLLFFLKGGKRTANKEEVKTIHWATWTGVLGVEVNGIWEKYTDTNDVNACDASFQNEVLVTGDDFGLVKLFRFPCLRKGELRNEVQCLNCVSGHVGFSVD